MALVRIKSQKNVRTVLCEVCLRSSPVNRMVSVSLSRNGAVAYVCNNGLGFIASCEARFYAADKSELIKEFKKFSW